MKLGTKDLIKILPFDDQFKKDILERYDFLDEDQKFNIQNVVWDTYNLLFDMKLQENIDLALQMAAQNQEKLDKDFYDRVKEVTEQEFSSGSFKSVEQMDLAQTREKLQEILQKIESDDSN